MLSSTKFTQKSHLWTYLLYSWTDFKITCIFGKLVHSALKWVLICVRIIIMTQDITWFHHAIDTIPYGSFLLFLLFSFFALTEISDLPKKTLTVLSYMKIQIRKLYARVGFSIARSYIPHSMGYVYSVSNKHGLKSTWVGTNRGGEEGITIGAGSRYRGWKDAISSLVIMIQIQSSIHFKAEWTSIPKISVVSKSVRAFRRYLQKCWEEDFFSSPPIKFWTRVLPYAYIRKQIHYCSHA